MRARVKELLRPIVDELNTPGAVADELWAILTALRGPDASQPHFEVEKIKLQSTSRLRYAIGIRGSQAGVSCSGALVNNGPLRLLDQKEEALVGYHFVNHFERALKIIEKKDDEV